MKSRTIVITISALALVALLAACGKQQVAKAESKETTSTADLPQDVKSVAAVASTTQAEAVTAPADAESQIAKADGNHLVATGEFISPLKSELAAKQPGRVARVMADEGQTVRKGQPLLQLETDYSRLDVERARAELARATAAANDAARDFERKKDLRAKDSIPQALYDKSQSTYEQSIASKQSAQAALSLAQQKLADSVVYAPVTGVIVERRTDVGEHLSDNSVTFVVAQTAPLKLRFKIPERYVAAVHHGDAVRAAVDAYANEKFAGRVSIVSGVVDPATRTFFAEAEFPNSDGRLRPGMFARVEMDLR